MVTPNLQQAVGTFEMGNVIHASARFCQIGYIRDYPILVLEPEWVSMLSLW